jgi:uncharacterized repeat protein (TIGR01451 family)
MVLSWSRRPSVREFAVPRPSRFATRPRGRTSFAPRLEILEGRTLLNAADLSVSLTGSPATLVPGALLTYTLTVQNNGPQDTSGSPTVTETLPTGLQLIAASSDRGTVSLAGNTVTATPGVLANGASATITVQATPTSATTLSNTASVAAATGDTDDNPTNNTSAPVRTTVNAVPATAADLQVTASASPTSAIPGQGVTLTFAVANLSTANPATSAALGGHLPANFLVIAATAGQGTVTASDGTFTANLGTVNNGTPVSVTVFGTPTAAGAVNTTAVATTAAGDSMLGNNSVTISTNVGPVPATAADLQVAFTAAPMTAVAGENLSYTITVTNLSTANAAGGTVLTVPLPAGLTFVSATPSAGTAQQAGGVVTADLGSVSSATPTTLTITARAAAVGSVSLTATATTAAGDSRLANNVATAATTVSKAATTTALTISPTTPNLGQAVTLTATVTATAPATGVPTGTVTFRDGTTTLGTGNLNAGGVATLSVAQGLTAGRHGLTAVYGGDVNFNGSTSATVTATVRGATTTTLTSSPNPSTAGQTVTFMATVTAAGGASGTPTGNVTFQSGAQTLGTAALSGGVATFATAALAAGATSVTATYAGDTAFTGSTSAAVVQTVNAVTLGQGNTCYVTQLYSDLLGRQPDSGGLQGWVNALNGNLLTRTQVALGFVNSTEYRSRMLDQLYAQLLRRAVDPSGRSGWLGFLASGGTLEQVEAGILGSVEYFQVRGGSTVSGFVDALYSDVLGRAVDASGLATFNNAVSQGLSRTLAAQTILTSAEADTREVNSLFNQFLRRAPDASGTATFFRALQSGLPNESATAAVVASDEYFSKFCTM